MMIYKVISLLDRGAKAFQKPVCVPGIGVATRELGTQVNSQDGGNLYLYPDDFDLYELGEFDDEFGSFKLLQQPKLVMCLSELKTAPAPHPVGIGLERGANGSGLNAQ